ncbi:MAG: NUDIX domain-containing protein [Cyanobacteria bacterium P01_A01_bin.105]
MVVQQILMKYCPACGASSFQTVSPKQFKCGACGFVYFQNVAAAAGAVIEAAGQVLLVQRAKDPDRGMLDLPGGFVDPGESLEQALVRELQEELGLTLTATDCGTYFCSSVNEYFYKGILYHSLDMFFLIRLGHVPEIAPADDVGDYLWAVPEEIALEAVAFSSVREALQVYLAQFV